MKIKLAVLSLLLLLSIGSDAQLNHDLKGPKRKNNPFVVKSVIKKDSLNVIPIEFEYQKGIDLLVFFYLYNLHILAMDHLQTNSFCCTQ